MTKQKGIIHNDHARQWTDNLVQNITAWGKSAAMVMGAVAINVVDVMIGGLMISIMFKDIDFMFGSPIDGVIIGMGVSFSLLFVQFVLWDRILKGGLKLRDIFPVVIAFSVAFFDTNLDVSPIALWIGESVLRTNLEQINSIFPFWGNLFDMVDFSLTWATYITLGFSEIVTALFIRGRSGAGKTLDQLFGKSQKRQSSKRKSSQRKKSNQKSFSPSRRY